MEIWDTYIVNEYLKVNTHDKIYIISGTEFGDSEGHVLFF